MYEAGIVRTGDSLKQESQDDEAGITVEEPLARCSDWLLVLSGVGEQTAGSPSSVKVCHSDFGYRRPFGAPIEVIVRS